jgi:phosphatidylserine/phosphatidylglycerophosphate/cardiolipin synthase-like enzyme
MDDQSNRTHRDRSRKEHNEEFLQRLYARRPQAKAQYQKQEAAAKAVPPAGVSFEATAAGVQPAPAMTPFEAVLETIVREERPVLFVKDDWIDTEHVEAIGQEAEDLIKDLDAKRAIMQPLMSLIGRIDVAGFPGNDFLGTGWFVDTEIVVTNRHVAELIARWDGRKFAFVRGVGGRPVTSSVSTLHEFDDLVTNQNRIFAVDEVLYIEPAGGPDIAFLKVQRRTDGTRPDHIDIAAADVGANVPIFTVGYPARAPRSVIPDQALMKKLYLDRYDVKRAAPGFTMSPGEGATRHDCTTLGGASGSPVLDLATGKAVGLHFAGLYQETNYAVRASLLSDYVSKKRWNTPPVIETLVPPPRPKTALQAPPPSRSGGDIGSGAVTVTLPLSITVSLGQPIDPRSIKIGVATPGSGTRGGADGGGGPKDPATVERAAQAFWKARPEGVVAVRVGFDSDGDEIGDVPFIAASVPANRLDAVEAAGPASFEGCEVRYIAANVAEQIDAMPQVESVDSIAYDDSARTGEGFSFDQVKGEPMTVQAIVGPEYSWDELHTFIDGARKSLVSAIYEFQSQPIKDAIEQRLGDGVSLTLVMDNATFAKAKDAEEAFDRIPVFAAWEKKFKTKFKRIVAPEGISGLISDSYHIKVTVREDDTLWLSSGNWKKASSQPVITDEMRDDATDTDLPGNREWHVVIKNTTLADRFRNHIKQDFKRSEELGGGKVPKSKEAADIFVDIPVEEEAVVVEERRPPSRLLKPKAFQGDIKVKPLLTPDKEGAVFSKAVLELIRSAKKSLLFQIPYIGMPSNPTEDRGFIDELIDTLVQKLKSLDDARVILRVGGSRFSAPMHAAWFFKSKGIDIANQLHQIEDHHTKGMIVDGKRVLIGSHNWSKPGVSLNRDASLIFDDQGIAEYFTEAFEIDWERSNSIRPKKFVKKKKQESVMLEAVGAAPPLGFRRVRLSELLKEDD